jgi:hypothetical protein
MNMCNKEGGAHIDIADEDYSAMQSDPGWEMKIAGNVIKGWELASVRQIGYEIELSLKENYSKILE